MDALAFTANSTPTATKREIATVINWMMKAGNLTMADLRSSGSDAVLAEHPAVPFSVDPSADIAWPNLNGIKSIINPFDIERYTMPQVNDQPTCGHGACFSWKCKFD